MSDTIVIVGMVVMAALCIFIAIIIYAEDYIDEKLYSSGSKMRPDQQGEGLPGRHLTEEEKREWYRKGRLW